MDRKVYNFGLFGKERLVCEGSFIYCYMTYDNEDVMLICDKNEKRMKMKVRRENEREYEEIDDDRTIEKMVKKVLNDDGSRWEGDWYDDKAFGFGSVYDEEGNRIYSGFMFEGMRVGFGTEYFADNHKVDYCGNFMNDKRHGWGESYDRNSQRLYEGDWRCGKNDFEEKIVIEDNCEEDDLRIHDLIKELEIGENCLNEWKDDLVIDNYSNLQSIVMKKNSLKNLNSLKICNCEKLKTIEIEDGDRYDNGALVKVKEVIIESI